MSFPVVPGSGGNAPGQNRDKTITHSFPLFAGLIVALFGVLVVPGITNANEFPSDPPPPEEPASEDPLSKRHRVQAEIAQLAAEYHARLPRDASQCLGSIYARYSSRHQDSIADQVRTLLADAVQKKIFVPVEFIFFDLSVRGFKNDRVGLNGLRACLQSKSVKAALFFATNRLFRKNYRSLQFVEEQIVERGIRAVFVKSGVDTADVKKWRSLLNMHAMMDEFVVTTNVDHIRAAHEGLLEKSLVFGTVSFGYRGEVIPGPLTRRGRPRKSLAVDDVAADYVRKVFDWFVTDRVSILAIVRRLKADPVVPPPPKSPNRVWTRQAVMRVLTNARYRGCWRYGVTETVWISSKDYARQVDRTAPLKSVQLETLRLVGDDIWFAAQSLFEREAAKMVGRKPRDGDSASRPRVLNGLFVCAAHDRILYVGGPHGRSMFCKDCQAVSVQERPLFSLLPRVVALHKTCVALANRIRQDSDLVQRVVASCQRHAENKQAPDPAQVTALTTRLAKLDHRIQFVLRNPGETDRDTTESTTLVKQLRHERATVQAESDAVFRSGRPGHRDSDGRGSCEDARRLGRGSDEGQHWRGGTSRTGAAVD